MKKIILASTSPFRQELLQKIGLNFECISPEVDEKEIQNSSLGPQEISQELARLKAQAVFKNHSSSIVIGGDQVLSFKGKIFGKPGNKENAMEQLRMLQGSTHELITSIAVCSSNDVRLHTTIAKLSMRQLNKQQIERYLDYDQPYQCCGSYRLEARGISLFNHIACDDHTAIIGLPLMGLCHILNGLGYPIP